MLAKTVEKSPDTESSGSGDLLNLFLALGAALAMLAFMDSHIAASNVRIATHLVIAVLLVGLGVVLLKIQKWIGIPRVPAAYPHAYAGPQILGFLCFFAALGYVGHTLELLGLIH